MKSLKSVREFRQINVIIVPVVLLLFEISGMSVMSSCSYQKPQHFGSIQCTLKGEVIDRPKSKKLILMKVGDDPRIKGELLIPIKKGKFEYVLNCDHEEIYRLIFENEWKRGAWRYIDFISEQGSVNFTLHSIDQSDMNIVEGGPINKEYLEYKNVTSNKNKELEPLQAVQAKFKEITGTTLVSSATEDLYYQIMREDSTYQEWLLWKLAYAREHPTIVGYSMLLSITRNELNAINDFSPYNDVYQTIFASKYPDHPYTVQMIDLFTRSSFKAGMPYIDFTAVDFTGKPIKLSERITGKPAVLHLWASWCGPCRQKGKDLIPVYEEFRNKGFVVVGVARERGSSAAAEAAVKQDKYPWENLVEIDDVEKIWNKYGIGNAGGSDFLIDENGIIVAVAPSIDEIKKYLKNR